ncbi:MAG TPA: energy transducer TonB [Cellvibrio sp.]|nr:energy transducer TonB [Cellvibrio sp.]
MPFTILSKRTRRTVGITATVIVTSVIVVTFMSSYQKAKNKAVPKVNLVQAAIYASREAGVPVLYEAVLGEQCIQQVGAVSFSSAASSAPPESNSTESSSASNTSHASSQQSSAEPPLVNASSPKCLAQTQPPEGYEQLGRESFVTLSLNLAQSGRVERGEVEKTSGFAELDAAALKQVTETWQFEPCKKAEMAVACRQYIRFRWRIE